MSDGPAGGKQPVQPARVDPPSESELSASLTVSRRIMILMAVVLGSTLYATTLLVASTLLPQMQGSMAATQDEIAWATTFNILATAIVTPMTGWLVANFGRRRVMVGSVALFTVATYLCGQSDSLETLILWRILQGGAGAPVVPLSNATVIDSFPRRQAGLISSIFGMSVVIGPVIGPTLGGMLAEAYSWRWAFYMIVPAGMLATVALYFALPKDGRAPGLRLDWTGFLSLSVAIGCVQLVLSRGQRLDWYESSEIIIETLIAALAFYVFLAHALTAQRPFLNLRLLKDRNFALGLVLVFVYGMLNFTPVVMLPPLLQAHAGYPDSIIGMIVGFRGIGGVIGFFSMVFIGKLDPRIGMTLGFGLMVVSGLWLMSMDLNTGEAMLLANSTLQGLSVGIVWVPLSVMAFSTMDSRYTPEGMAVFHLLRNIGSSFFISLSFAEVIASTSANYSRMTELISPYSRMLNLPTVMGGWNVDTLPGLAALSKEINRQAAMIGYLNAFSMYTATAFAAVLLVWLAGKRKRAAAAG